MQAHNFYFTRGKSKLSSATNRDLIELDLIEEYHWLPQDIAKIPYKRLQKIFLLKKCRDGAVDLRQEVDRHKAEAQNPIKGKKMYREV